jgi:alkanesulfonate monooxygenase SsuD/methylene tetrahydromethanopterin reductase-like flavin-dependent oxidoreductase (luciferase family)
MDGFWEAIARVGADDNPFRAGFLQLVCVSETDAQAEREYFPHVHYFYQKCLNVWEGFAEAPGYRTVKTVQSGSRAQVGAAARKARQSLDWGQYVDQGYIIAGSPATVRQQLTECIRSLRVGHLMVLLQIGSMPKELAFKNTELFAKEVMPHVRDQWSGYKDRWWPTGARNGS